MQIIYQTEEGYVATGQTSRQLIVKFHNFSLEFTPRSLRKLLSYLQDLVPHAYLFDPEDRCFEVTFATYPMSLHFKYLEIKAFAELIEEGLFQLSLETMLSETGVNFPSDAQV